ncbi:MAG: IS21-like element helper ATPase IstB [Spirochaetia bacterium]|nr:IS21-like element helper ATPase IstB [Spirochaetia bacterium]
MSRQLMLSNSVVELCEEATPKQEDFLYKVLCQEIVHREHSRQARLLNRAKFPVLKSLDTYEFGAIRLPPSISKQELFDCEFMKNNTNLICFGPVGTGKTHLVIALGVHACSMGLKVRFFTVTELVLKLSEARKNGTLERLITDLKRQDVLILDEFGYVPIDKEGSQLLFRVISDSYESKSLLITTNLEFSKWGSIFTDGQMAAAMIDRLVHHGHLLVFEGQSYRMKHALMRQASGTAGESREQ